MLDHPRRRRPPRYFGAPFRSVARRNCSGRGRLGSPRSQGMAGSHGRALLPRPCTDLDDGTNSLQFCTAFYRGSRRISRDLQLRWMEIVARPRSWRILLRRYQATTLLGQGLGEERSYAITIARSPSGKKATATPPLLTRITGRRKRIFPIGN